LNYVHAVVYGGHTGFIATVSYTNSADIADGRSRYDTSNTRSAVRYLCDYMGRHNIVGRRIFNRREVE